jgi:hypothetical protein
MVRFGHESGDADSNHVDDSSNTLFFFSLFVIVSHSIFLRFLCSQMIIT